MTTRQDRGEPLSDWVEKVTTVATIACLGGALLAIVVGWFAIQREPDGLDFTGRDPVTDLKTYDVDANGEPEFVEIEGGIHEIPTPTGGVDLGIVLVPVAGAIVSALIGAASSIIVGRLNKDVGERLQSLERRLSELDESPGLLIAGRD